MILYPCPIVQVDGTFLKQRWVHVIVACCCRTMSFSLNFSLNKLFHDGFLDLNHCLVGTFLEFVKQSNLALAMAACIGSDVRIPKKYCQFLLETLSDELFLR